MASILYGWLMLYASLFTCPAKAEPALAKHPFYIAVTEINLNTSDKTLEVSCKMFADDLEQTLEKRNHAELDISAEKDKGKFNSYIPAYIKSHLSLSVDGKATNLSYIGFEKEKESAYCYFQVENVSSLKKLEVNDSILHDFTSEQINIIHVTVNGKRQSTKLDYPSTNASFSF
ncbi:MAG: DUF6702 family protein [Flavisolibacter sp.]